MERTLLSLGCWLLLGGLLSAQQRAYFQQELRYEIAVQLDDQTHVLQGEWKLEYTNRSPDSLTFLYLHLWPNAYQSRETAFSKQLLQQGDDRFFFAPEEERGALSGLAFTADGRQTSWEPDDRHPDIARLQLPEPLAPGATVRLYTPFRVQLPRYVSRSGHIGQSYYVAQWYPKPAVYDREGWHPMPYLEDGEFYSEFATYEVQLTLPYNYVVGATGALQTADERPFLIGRSIATEQHFVEDITTLFRGGPEKLSTPPSSDSLKTIRFKAEQVHDFAWFADKNFQVLHETVERPDSSTIDLWVLFTRVDEQLWKNVPAFARRALAFYSDQLGLYPYPQLTIVQNPYAERGGMEYPMITLIDRTQDEEELDLVIAHEIGHNWLYGILANNEREHPWMDEGINTFYENRYREMHYDAARLTDYLGNFLANGSDLRLDETYYLMQARKHRDQAPDTPAEQLGYLNYSLAAYDKPAWAFDLLEAYLGKDTFDHSMRSFYEQWQFKHPRPADLQKQFEQMSRRSLDWFFSGLIGSNAKLDYALQRIECMDATCSVSLRNRGAVASPVLLETRDQSGSVLHRQWIEGFAGDTTVIVPAGPIGLAVLDPDHLTPDLYRHNNQRKADGFLPRLEPLHLKFMVGFPSSSQTNLYFSPLAAWNDYDKVQMGLALYNYFFLEKPFEWALAPMISTKTGELTGAGHARFHWYPQAPGLQRWTLQLGIRSFHDDYNDLFDFSTRYYRLSPSLRLDLATPATSAFRHFLQWRTLFIGEEEGQVGIDGFSGLEWQRRIIHELSYAGWAARVVNPFGYRIALEQQSYTSAFGTEEDYLRLSLEGRSAYTYAAGRNLSFRFFGGFFLRNTRREGGAIFPGAFNLTAQGYRDYDDYRYDGAYFARNADDGFGSQQIEIRDGGFKNAFSDAFRLTSGNSNNLLLAINVEADLPFRLPWDLPLRPYLDLAYADDATPAGADKSFSDQIWWSGGLSLDFEEIGLGLFAPLFHSQNIRELYDQDGRNGLLSRLTFRFDLSRLDLLQDEEDRQRWW